MRARRFAPLALLSLLLTSCGGEPQAAAVSPTVAPTETPAPTPPTRCAMHTLAYIEAVHPIRDEFNHALLVAQSTVRMSLAPQITELQKIVRKAKSLEVPGCIAEVHILLLTGMDTYLTSLLDFMSQKADEGVMVAQFELAKTYIDTYESSLADILAGKASAAATPAPTVTPKK